jgi:hypothetical protein
MLHRKDGLRIPLGVTFGSQAKASNLNFIRPENFVFPLGAFWQTPSRLEFAFY